MARKVSEAINVRDFLGKWNTDLFELCACRDDDDRDVISKRMKISSESVKELETVCSLSLLETKAESKVDRWKSLEKIPEDLNLMCVRFQKQEVERRKSSSLYNTSMLRRLKYKINDEMMAYNAGSDVVRNVDLPEEQRVIYPDVVMTVHVHRPMKITQHKGMDKVKIRVEQMVVQSTYLVLGRQKLTDLRDTIRCVNDLTVAGDLSENPDMDNQVFSKMMIGELLPFVNTVTAADPIELTYLQDIFKSGFFFIEDLFYNDLREEDARDYSQIIRDWANEPGRSMGPYKTQLMEDTTFLDLTVRLGKPYLYFHQGDCEHLIVFSDIRLLTSEDPQAMKDYPYMRRRVRRARTMCRVCFQHAARWITYGSEFTPENPFFFCDGCFRSLNYDKDNKKIGSFEAYKYFDHHAII